MAASRGEERLENLVNDSAAADGSGTIRRVDDGFVRIETERVKDRRGEIRRADSSAHRFGSVAIGGAVYDTTLHTAAGECDREDRAPVIAPGVLVDSRRAPHLAHPHDERLVEEPASFEVFDERRERAIETRHEVAEVLGVLDVGVPPAARCPRDAHCVDLHERDTGLDETPREENALTVSIVSVAFADSGILEAQVERGGGASRSEKVERLLMPVALAFKLAARLVVSKVSIESVEQSLAATQAEWRDRVGQGPHPARENPASRDRT